MTEEARAARNEYARAWRAANRDRVKKYNRSYWERRARAAQEAAGGSSGEVTPFATHKV